ncbi:MAG: sugar transferase, partial [Anaerolineales bacterium]|nr:sugar transferase [Anaerolineales bacterium]
ILISILGMIVLSPFFAFITILIKREGAGLIIYHGPRSGRGGKDFGILKFRTMVDDPKSYKGPRVTAKDDNRITPLGKWLRNTKLNELPQLWNVLMGEMSLVGPRPEDPEIVKTWPADARAEILSMRPGITSPASILYRNEESMLPADGTMDVYLRNIVPDKLRLDSLYVRNHSFMGDLDVIFWTAVALIPMVARQQIPEGDLFVGPFYRFARHYFSWFMLDFLVSLAIVGIIGLIWRAFVPFDWGLIPLALLAFAIAVFFSIVNVLFGLDRVYWSRADADDGFLLVISNGISSIIIFLLNSLVQHNPWLLPLPALPPEMIVLIGVFILMGSLSIRYRLRLVTSFASRWLNWRGEKTGFGERVLIVGAGEGGEIVHWLMRHGSFRQIFSVIGMVDDDPAKRGMRVNHSWVLGSSSELPHLIRKHDIGVVLFAITNISEEAHGRMVGLCQQSGVRLIYLNDLLGAIQTQLSGSTSSRKNVGTM